MKIKIYESDKNIPDKYYAIVYADGTAMFASMPAHFDWAVDMLAEDGNDDACIGLIENGVCTKTWSRDDVGIKDE